MAHWEEYCKKIVDNDFIRIRCSDCKTDAPLSKSGIYQAEVAKCPKCGADMGIGYISVDLTQSTVPDWSGSEYATKEKCEECKHYEHFNKNESPCIDCMPDCKDIFEARQEYEQCGLSINKSLAEHWTKSESNESLFVDIFTKIRTSNCGEDT